MTLLKSWLVFLVVFVWARFALARIRTDQILEFGWRMLLPLAVLQVVLALVYRLYLFNQTACRPKTTWRGHGLGRLRHPLPRPCPDHAVLAGGLWVYLNDEDKSAMSERMFHVHTVEPAERLSRGRSEVKTMPMHPHAQPNFRNLFWYPFKITLITALRTFPFIGKRFGKNWGPTTHVPS